mmetsp:Transcript_13343/g.27074  ORF Transcript_13343/g.27074 Transcript_13343/m.27074 type:complete len:504 (-) Transcript_13343:244-1755(-)
MSQLLRASLTSTTSWVMGIRIKKESQSTDIQLREKFSYTEAVYAKDANGNKQGFSTYRPSEFGPYTERNLMMFNDLVTYCEKTSIDGEARLELLDTVFEGDVRREWDDLCNRGNDHWDPAALPIDNASVRKAMEALLTEVLHNPSPGNTQHQKLQDMQYKHFKDEGFFLKPTLYYKRLEYLWFLSKWLLRQGAPPDDSQQLDAQIRGVPETWMQWVERRNRDIRDLANNGAQPWTCQDLFNELDIYWAEFEEPKLQKYLDEQDGKSNNKRRRNDDTNDEEEVKKRRYDTNDEEEDYRAYPNEEDEKSDEYSEDDSDDERSESDDDVEEDDASTNSNRVNDGRNNFFEKSCPIHDGTLLAHHPHQYKECIFAFGKKNFRLDRANALAQSGTAPEFWINTYNKGKQHWWTKNNKNYEGNQASNSDVARAPPAPPQQQPHSHATYYQHVPQVQPQPQVTYAYQPQQAVPQPSSYAHTPVAPSAANLQDFGSYYLINTPTGWKKVPK